MGKKQAKTGVLPWNRIPELINGLRYRISTEATELLDYDPIRLTVFSNRRYALYANNFYAKTLGDTRQLFDMLKTRDMDLETFKFTLEQIPSVRTIEFTGRGEPLLNPELFEIIRHARNASAAEITLHTNGMLLDQHLGALINDPPDTLVIHLYGHKPSMYYALSGLDARHYTAVRDNIAELVRLRRELGSSFRLVARMLVDDHHLDNIPDMIRAAEQLGVDELRLDNYETPDGAIDPERSLFDDDKSVTAYFAELEAFLLNYGKLKVTLPRLFRRKPDSGNRCRAPFQHVGVDGDCNVTPCPLQRIGSGPESVKVWDETFWNSELYRFMRNIHGTAAETSLPDSCQSCAHRC